MTIYKNLIDEAFTVDCRKLTAVACLDDPASLFLVDACTWDESVDLVFCARSTDYADGFVGDEVTQVTSCFVPDWRMPDPRDGVMYIVPREAAIFLHGTGRKDVVFPDGEFEPSAVNGVKRYERFLRPVCTTSERSLSRTA